MSNEVLFVSQQLYTELEALPDHGKSEVIGVGLEIRQTALLPFTSAKGHEVHCFRMPADSLNLNLQILFL